MVTSAGAKTMNETATTLSPDCRALYRWIGCGADFQNSLRIFYSIFFGIHAVSSIVALIYTAHVFFSCCGRRVDSKSRKLSLRIFTCLSIVVFFSACVYCFFLIDPRGYGMPGWLAMALWAGSCNCLGSAAALLVFTWAEALSQNKNVKNTKGFLKNYRVHYLVVIVDRSISTAILALAGADFGGNSYMILVRVFCAHWSAFAIFLVAAMLYYGRQMRERIVFGAKNTFSNIRDSRLQQTNRLIILYVGTASSCAIFAALQAGLMHILDSNPAVWLFFLSCFHIVITALATWFIIGRPSENQLTRQRSGSSSTSSGTNSTSTATSPTCSTNSSMNSSTNNSTASTSD